MSQYSFPWPQKQLHALLKPNTIKWILDGDVPKGNEDVILLQEWNLEQNRK